MKDFSKSSYNFSTISIGQKLTYTSFLLLMLGGWASLLIFYARESGWGYWSLVEYYRGSEEKLLFPKTFYALWEVTHFHLFTVPVVFLILIHLFMLTRARLPWKMGLLMASFLGMVLDMGSPWMIVYLDPLFAGFKILGRVLLNGSFLLLALWPMKEMWFSPASTHRRHRVLHRSA